MQFVWGISVSHYKESYRSYIDRHSTHKLNYGQQLIQSSMDSCKYTILDEFPRCVGKTTAVTQYIEWEFLHSPTPLNFHVSPHLLERYGMEYFEKLRAHTCKNNTWIHTNTGSKIIPYRDSIDNILSNNSIPHVIFIDIKFNMDKFIPIHDAIESMKGRRYTSYKSTYLDYYPSTRGFEPEDIDYTETTYDGARYIITAQYAHEVVKYLLSKNVDEDNIGYITEDSFAGVTGYNGEYRTYYNKYNSNFCPPTYPYPP